MFKPANNPPAGVFETGGGLSDCGQKPYKCAYACERETGGIARKMSSLSVGRRVPYAAQARPEGAMAKLHKQRGEGRAGAGGFDLFRSAGSVVRCPSAVRNLPRWRHAGRSNADSHAAAIGGGAEPSGTPRSNAARATCRRPGSAAAQILAPSGALKVRQIAQCKM